MVSLVYSFSVEAISNFKPNLSHNFFDRYSPIPVAFALFLFEPVKPFSNTRDKSDAFIPQPLSSITSNIFHGRFLEVFLSSCHAIAIGNFLMLSPSFPPLHTVHETFASYGVPSYPNRFISYFPVIVWYP